MLSSSSKQTVRLDTGKSLVRLGMKWTPRHGTVESVNPFYSASRLKLRF